MYRSLGEDLEDDLVIIPTRMQSFPRVCRERERERERESMHVVRVGCRWARRARPNTAVDLKSALVIPVRGIDEQILLTD